MDRKEALEGDKAFLVLWSRSIKALMHMPAAKWDRRPRERTAASRYSVGEEVAAWVVALMIVVWTLDLVLE